MIKQGKGIRSNDEFLDTLRASHCAVGVVNEWLRSMGWWVTAVPNLERPDYASRMDYTDEGDLLISDENNLPRPIEVKHCQMHDITTKKEYPHKKVFVDRVDVWERKPVKPWFTIRVGKDKKSGFVFKSSKQPLWQQKTIVNNDGKETVMYACDIELCTLVSLKPTYGIDHEKCKKRLNEI